MLESRQQAVTREQVRHKAHDAEHRALDAVTAATEAKSAAEYSKALRAAVKATNDYRTWRQVLCALERS